MILLIVIAVGLVILLTGIVFSCAVYALPFYAGVLAAKLAYHHDAGILGAVLIGALFAGVVWGVGQAVFGIVRSPSVRFGVAALYAAPAAFAGYQVVQGLLKSHDIASGWLTAWSTLAGLTVACTAVARLIAPPGGQAARMPMPSRPTSPTRPAVPLRHRSGAYNRRAVHR